MPRMVTTPPPRSWADAKEHIFKLADAIAAILRGKTNNTGEFTLAAGTTSTVVTDAHVTPSSVITWGAKTATAAAAMTALRYSAGVGQLTLTHDNTADVDRRFGYAAHG